MQRKVNNLRWIIAGLLFFATLINYLDRQLLSVVAPMLQKELNLTNTQYAFAVNSFLVAYGIMFTVGGWLLDILKTRRGLALSLALWSAASAAHTFTVGALDLCIYRFLLGVTEPGNFTAAVKGVSSWFPSKERGVAIGFVVAGTGLGAIVAPPLVVWLATNYGWRMAFLLPSLVGFMWLPLWLYLYQEPKDHPWITEKELSHIESGNSSQPPTAEKPPLKWGQLLSFPQTWAFILVRFFGDPLGFFCWFWLPNFLVSAKGFRFEDLGKWLWVPYLVQAAGQIVGGLFSGELIRRGVKPILARKIGVSVPLFFIPLAILSVYATGFPLVLAYVSCATFGLGWWGANYNAAVMDTVPRNAVGSVSGIAGSAGIFSSTLSTWYTGYAADHYSYLSVFLLNIGLMVVSAAGAWVFLRKPMDESRANA